MSSHFIIWRNQSKELSFCRMPWNVIKCSYTNMHTQIKSRFPSNTNMITILKENRRSKILPTCKSLLPTLLPALSSHIRPKPRWSPPFSSTTQSTWAGTSSRRKMGGGASTAQTRQGRRRGEVSIYKLKFCQQSNFGFKLNISNKLREKRFPNCMTKEVLGAYVFSTTQQMSLFPSQLSQPIHLSFSILLRAGALRLLFVY